MLSLRQPFTWASVVLTVGGIALLSVGEARAAASVLLLAQVSAMAEFKPYTGVFQFVMVGASSALLGWAIDLSIEGSFHFTGSLMCASLAMVLRQAFMPVFTYVRLLWVEPVLITIAALPLVSFWMSGTFTWLTHVYPLAALGGALFLSGSYIQDAVFMKRRTRNGYRVQPGMSAPDFVLPDSEGGSVQLSGFAGKHPVLLIFVRGDWCPGCHMMLRTYERHSERFRERGVHVIGIGPDSVEVNRDMVQRIGVGYKLLSDHGQQVSQRYGVVYDNPVLETAVNYAEGIPLPASFLVDIHGVVRYVSRPDRVGEFLDPTLIFSVLDQLPQNEGTFPAASAA